MDWKDYFKPPFFTDEFNPGMIWDAEFEMVSSPTDLMECVADNNVFLAERVMENVVEAINAKCEGREPKCTVQFDDVKYAGSGRTNRNITDDAKSGAGRMYRGLAQAAAEPSHGMPYSIRITVPPLGGCIFRKG